MELITEFDGTAFLLYDFIIDLKVGNLQKKTLLIIVGKGNFKISQKIAIKLPDVHFKKN
jgi:hypothetical protein